MKHKIKVGEIVFTVLFVLVICFVLSVIIQLSQGETPTVFGYSVMFVETDSMEPDIPAKSLILVKKRDFEKAPPKQYEVVCFYSNKLSALITHRVIETGDGFVITKGDNASGDDGKIMLSQIQFSYVGNITFLSGIARAIRQPWGFALMVILPCVCVFGLLTFNIFKASTSIAKEKLQEGDALSVEEIKKQAIEDYIKNHENQVDFDSSRSQDIQDNQENINNQ